MKIVALKTSSVVAVTILLFLMVFGTSAQNATEKKQEVMKRLNSYVGKWKSDTKTNRQNGSEYYFTYEFSHYNPDKTIFKMVITQHFVEGKKSLMWEGFKGWNPVKEEFYYYGFSPMGRFSTGKVITDGEKLVTTYTGFAASGSPVQIIDEFYPVNGGEFKSITNLKPEGGDWQVIGRDTWSKM